MRLKLSMLLAVLLSLSLLAGCAEKEDPADQPETQSTEPELLSAAEATTVPETTESLFESYQLRVKSPKLAVHAGPGYSYDTIKYITDQGSYTIIAEETEKLGGGAATVWGKLSGAGWINLEDALAEEEEEPTEETKEAEEAFEPYIIAIKNPYLSIYSGPGYGYDLCGEITDRGSYTIVEESREYFHGGGYVTWGRLKSGVGWICLDDAKMVPNTGGPYRCTYCGRTDVYITRYGLCDECYDLDNKNNGQCEHCGTYFPTPTDELRCQNCFWCEECGWYVHQQGYMGPDATVCKSCSGSYCVICGVELNEWNTAFEGFGKCTDCYYDTLDPYYICDICGADCSFRGVYDGLCEDCYDARNPAVYCWNCGAPCEPGDEDALCDDCDDMFCDDCGDPLVDDHNCGG